VRKRRWAAVVLPQQPLPVALVVAGHHHPTVHACAPLSAVLSLGRGPPLGRRRCAPPIVASRPRSCQAGGTSDCGGIAGGARDRAMGSSLWSPHALAPGSMLARL